MLQSHRMRWGGDLRRTHLFRALARRTEATVIDGWGRRALRREFGLFRILPTPIRHLRPRPMPRLASSEMIHSRYLRMALRVLDPAVVAVYDDAVAQTASLGMTMSPDQRALFTSRRDDNLATFRWHAVPTASFAEMIGLDRATTLVAGNGTNAAHIRPGPWPERPAIGMVSGAAPGRGMETLIAAARGLRAQVPDLQLLLWLVPTGPESEDYLEGLRASTAREEWIRIDTVDYERIGESLALATVLTVPHPPDAYMDVALPVKLFDSMAAGRPLVVTPRTETRAVVERHGAGVVTAGDTTDDLAGALLGVLEDQSAARRMGAAARLAAEQHYDWSVVGERIADLVIEREGNR